MLIKGDTAPITLDIGKDVIVLGSRVVLKPQPTQDPKLEEPEKKKRKS